MKKRCPYPGCQRAVSLPESEHLSPRPAINGRHAVKTLTGLFQVPSVSHSVDCGSWHYFCWECGGRAHAPLVCGLWQQWRDKCGHMGHEGWLVTHTRPCPNCQSPVAKSDGCNHTQCPRCRFDFCWVCLESWKKHSTSAYFRCNRFSGVAGITSTAYVASVTSDKDLKVLEAGRLLHYFTRYKNHENSCTVEEPLLHRQALFLNRELGSMVFTMFCNPEFRVWHPYCILGLGKLLASLGMP